jgi:hypothetical protein
MKPIWIVENFVGENGYETLIEEVRKSGCECIVLDIRNHFELRPNLIDPDKCYVFQGSIQMFRKIKSEHPLACPLGWMTDDNYLCTNYYPIFQKHLFNDWHMFTSMAGLKSNKWNIYKVFGKETIVHLRPNGGDKTFSGQLIDLQDFDTCFSASRCSAKDTDIAVVTTPKNILWEGRYIVNENREIIAQSTYMYRGNRTYIPNCPEKATKLVHQILEIGYHPDPIYAVDVCEDNDNNFWLMEFNSFTSAGTYACNKQKIVEKVNEMALTKFNENC